MSSSVYWRKQKVIQTDMPSHRVTGNRNGPPIDLEDVASVISRLHFEIQNNATTGYREYIYTRSLAEMICDSTNLATFALAEHVEETISRLSRIFAQLNEDAAIATPVKTLVFSIAVSVLANALLDEHYLVDGTGSALQFMEALKKMSPWLSPSSHAEKDIFYKKLSYLVDEINDQHSKDIKIFDKSLGKLEKMVESEKNRQHLLQKRTQEMEAVKSRLDAAHSRMRAAIAVRTYKKDIPKITRNFIDKQWEAVLFFHFNKNEEKRSEEFGRALHDLELLIDASLGKRIELKALFDSLDKDMALLGYPKGERIESLGQLLDEIKERQRRGIISSTPPVEKISQPVPVPEKAWDPNATMVIPAYNPEPESMEDDFDYLAADCRPNTLFRLTSPNGEKTDVKLAVIMRTGGEYIFVDGRGVKVLMATKREVAKKLRDGELVIQDTPQRFDKTLQAVIQLRRDT